MAKKSSYFFSNYRERLSLFIPFHFILSHSNQNASLRFKISFIAGFP